MLLNQNLNMQLFGKAKDGAATGGQNQSPEQSAEGINQLQPAQPTGGQNQSPAQNGGADEHLAQIVELLRAQNESLNQSQNANPTLEAVNALRTELGGVAETLKALNQSLPDVVKKAANTEAANQLLNQGVAPVSVSEKAPAAAANQMTQSEYLNLHPEQRMAASLAWKHKLLKIVNG